ncbi:MAG: DEAD/DEAH box helicase [Deltaproteobacteria bacterium]|nr:DEAD/DEAH box helicase [Deltaproteobacteria bacterium]
MEIQSFTDLHLIEPLARAVKEAGFTIPTPIQAKTIPHLLAGTDVIGCAETGTGKTAAFALPILQRLFAAGQKKASRKGARALVLTPTRELTAQVEESFRKLGKHLSLRTALVFGGVSQFHQVRAMSQGVDVLVATPGRLLDLIQQKYIQLSEVEYLVLDEADRMLDMGFLPPIKKIVAMLPKARQTLLFSATMESSVLSLAKTLLQNPVHVTVQQASPIVERLEESILFVDDANKRNLLSVLLKEKEKKRTLVFTRTKHRADQVAKHLEKSSIRTRAIHGNKSQNFRNAALADFRSGRCDVLVATDVASRGIDVTNITHVINFDLPSDPSNYIHRVGRTARAGTSGSAISFCASGDRSILRDIERLLKRSVTIQKEHPYHSEEVAGENTRSVRASSSRPRRFQGSSRQPQGRSRFRGHRKGQ